MDKQSKDDASSKQAQMNAVWQRIANKADEQSKVDEQVRLRQRMARPDGEKSRWSTAKKAIICVVSVIVLITIAFGVWFLSLGG